MSDAGQRIDKWLWYARFWKTRTAAARFVSDGKVRVNRVRVSKPGHTVNVGDVLTFTLNHRARIVEVLDPGSRRGPAAEARTLYNDLSPAPCGAGKPAGHEAPAAQAAREAGSGRPTKKERRDLDAWLEGSD